MRSRECVLGGSGAVGRTRASSLSAAAFVDTGDEGFEHVARSRGERTTSVFSPICPDLANDGRAGVCVSVGVVSSSDEYYEAHASDLAAWFEVADKDYLELIDGFDFSHILERAGPRPRLLDVGCGTGRFPSLLRSRLPTSLEIQYDHLDPVARCLAETRRVLEPPYRAGQAFEMTMDHFEPPAGGYDVVWSIHSLCAVPPDSLAATVDRFCAAIAATGRGFIYLQGVESFYSQVYRAYHGPDVPQLQTAEDVLACLESHSEVGVEVHAFEFLHSVPQSHLSVYLSKCVFDDRPSSYWRERPELRALLEAYDRGGRHSFPQTVRLIEMSGRGG